MPPIPKRAPAAPTGERGLQQEVRLALGREPGLVLWRNAMTFSEMWNPSTGAIDRARGGLVVGSADLIGILRVGQLGRFVALELKTLDGKLSDDQGKWLRIVRDLCGFGAVVRSVDEARAAIERARRGLFE